MDTVKRVTDLYEALDNSSLTNKAELKAEVKCCIDATMHYFSVVSDEKIYFLGNAKGNPNRSSIMFMEKRRSEAHDDAINACSRVNEICREVNVDDVCDFDTNDRRKVAEFCGILAGELFFSHIDNEITLRDYLTTSDKNLLDITERPGALYYKVVMLYCVEIITYLNSTYNASIRNYQALQDLLLHQKKWKFDVGNKQYYFHGHGCSVIIEGEEICCWDFGLNEHFETDINRLNFDVYKIATTLKHWMEGDIYI